MPRQNFYCGRCGVVHEDVFYPTPVYDAQHNRLSPWPPCPDCKGELEVRPTGTTNDLLPESFEVDLGNGPQRVRTLSEIRTIERDSEQRHRNGEGSISVLRDFSNSRSNRDVNTLSGSSYERAKSVKVDKDQLRRSGIGITGGAFRPAE